MTDTPAPPAPDHAHTELLDRVSQLELESREHRDHRTRVQTLLGLAGAAALVVILGAVSVRDLTLSTTGRVETIQSRVERIETTAARRDSDDRTTREALVRLQATVETLQTTVGALQTTIVSRLDAIEQHLPARSSTR